MKNLKKIILCIVSLALGLMTINLQLFVFEAPDGNLGFTLFLFSVSLVVGSFIGLCKLSEKFKSAVFNLFNLLFNLL